MSANPPKVTMRIPNAITPLAFTYYVNELTDIAVTPPTITTESETDVFTFPRDLTRNIRFQVEDNNSLAQWFGTTRINTLHSVQVSEIVDDIWDELISEHTIGGSTGATLSASRAPLIAFVEEFSNAVWEEKTKLHNREGTFGALLNNSLKKIIAEAINKKTMDGLRENLTNYTKDVFDEMKILFNKSIKESMSKLIKNHISKLSKKTDIPKIPDINKEVWSKNPISEIITNRLNETENRISEEASDRFRKTEELNNKFCEENKSFWIKNINDLSQNNQNTNQRLNEVVDKMEFIADQNDLRKMPLKLIGEFKLDDTIEHLREERKVKKEQSDNWETQIFIEGLLSK